MSRRDGRQSDESSEAGEWPYRMSWSFLSAVPCVVGRKEASVVSSDDDSNTQRSAKPEQLGIVFFVFVMTVACANSRNQKRLIERTEFWIWS